VGQTFPQLPQLLASFCVFAQPAGHPVGTLGGHEQLPEAHVRPPVQVTPQAPQLLGSLATARQTPPQLRVPAAQQTPDWQLDPAAQTLPQVPQFELLVAVSVHTPLQLVGAVEGQLQCPALHTVPPVPQAVPQAPQLALSRGR
jgi:hypothetical protein